MTSFSLFVMLSLRWTITRIGSQPIWLAGIISFSRSFSPFHAIPGADRKFYASFPFLSIFAIFFAVAGSLAGVNH
jgi:hypothetical protein